METTLARSTPSTSTLMLPSGSFRLWTMLTTVPTLKISLGLGSSMEASCCVARKIFLSPAIASSRARTLDSRPTTNGVIMNGKITTSRMGIIGKRLVSDFSFEVSIVSLWGRILGVHHPGEGGERAEKPVLLAGLFEQRQADLLSQYH